MAGQITGIKVQKRKRNRVSVYLDGEYTFSLGMGVAASLKRGDALSDEDVQELQLQDLVETAYDRTLRYLAYRPRSSAEVGRYLRQKKVSAEVSERVMERLRGAELLDDRAFAQYWVENREAFRPRGRRLLRQELRQKGIDVELIAEALSAIDDEQSARRAALKQATRYAHLDDDVFTKKMDGFLRRRGFGYDVVRETISRLLQQRSGDGVEHS